ncbi:hypothetical protein [Duganella sp. FT27W]|uniref:hypothetical protein n=1 Tax=Duganella sp. FT27W TaxID=2654636 RepID=UPI00128B177A|nr:hypothetical protein [Duganella sp. FT27W]MPQ56257.1 hypothetical protein [Duganella sp. FT27W]
MTRILVLKSYTATVDHLRDPRLVKCICENCETTMTADKLAPIESAILTPGHASPAGRCPECDQLAYVDQPDLQSLVEIVEQLLTCAELSQEELEPHTQVLIESARLIMGNPR